MASTAPDTQAHEHPFRGLDRSVEHVLGADMRLIYGLGAPLVMIIGLIIVLALSPTAWLVVAILLLEIAALGVVLYGFFGMLGETEDEPGD